MTAFPQLLASARHQLPPDVPMFLVLRERELGAGREECPNLLILTGQRCSVACSRDCEEHTGIFLPVLQIKEG